ncbi:uncharacterized protein LOC119771485 [Cyprinodon tularosa]|uniref:uncharacterized protein LOC119771485 n=1 Tax=Cyprinodon tularosa TaxID=77115 RepID=UPI0018E2721B|nr:uncharacterized protein LOC119771485 [Cyprinodon tularosa]
MTGFTEEMLVKVEYRGVQKYNKVPQITAKFCCELQLFTEGVLVLTDTSDTEVGSDIFDELLRSGVRAFMLGYQKQLATDIEISLVEDELQSSVQATPLVTPTSPVSLSDHSSSPASSCSSDSTLILKSTKNRKKGQEELDRDDAKQMVYTVLRSNPKGEEIFNEYHKTKTLSDATRRQMVNILVADMIESHGYNSFDDQRNPYSLTREDPLFGGMGSDCRATDWTGPLLRAMSRLSSARGVRLGTSKAGSLPPSAGGLAPELTARYQCPGNKYRARLEEDRVDRSQMKPDLDKG